MALGPHGVDFAQAVASGKVKVHRMITRACEAFDKALEKGDTSVATRVLLGTGVLSPDQATGNTNINYTFVTMKGRDDAP